MEGSNRRKDRAGASAGGRTDHPVSDPDEKFRHELRKKRWEEARRKQRRKNLIFVSAGAGAVLVLILILILVIRKPSGGAEHSSQIETIGQVMAVTPAPELMTASLLPGEVPDADSAADSAAESVAEAAESAEEIPETGPSLLISEIELKPADLSVDWNLVLVNPKRKLSEDYWTDITDIPSCDDDYLRFDYRAVDHLDQMMYDCADATGAGPYLRSAWRSWSDQESLLANKIEEWQNSGYSYEEASEIAKEWVAIPGTSEHELGLAVDIVSAEYPTMNSDQEWSPVHQWLLKHCQEYGFILRYPNGKSEITGIVYEPWHYRYVGKEAAEEIMSRGICLEEYLAELGMY